MYTQFQRFVATLLLFSILLQSCGNPNWNMVEPVGTVASGKTSKVKKRAPDKLLQMQDGSSEGSTVSKVDLSSEVDGALSAALPGAASCAQPKIPSRAAHENSQLGTSPPTPAHSPAVSASSSVQAARPSSGSKKNPRHNANKSRHVVLDSTSMARHVVRGEDDQTLERPTQSQALPPTSALHAERLCPVFSRQPQPKVQHALKSTERKESHLKPAIHLAFQPYPSAQGHQVRFQEADGKWLAQVKDTWGRAQLLPVICAPDQTPARALQQLSSKALGQHKYWVHVLETHQPPWAPRVVYVGAMGLRGGGTVENPIDTTITEAHALPKDAQQAYQIDQARDEKKQDPKQSAAIGTQHHHGSIPGNLFVS